MTKVFISWAGNSSAEIAKHLKIWLKICLPSINIFMSSEISSGNRWTVELAKQLQEIDYGLLIYTKENLDNLWMAFEAGALSKRHENSRIVPLLFDGVKTANLHDSIRQFQAKYFEYDKFLTLLQDLNDLMPESKRQDQEDLQNASLATWDNFASQVNEALKAKQKKDTVDATWTDRQLLEELLEQVIKLSHFNIPSIEEISTLLAQVTSTSQGNYLYIDGEKEAFEALIAGTYRASEIIRATRFSPVSIVNSYPRYWEAVKERVLGENGYKALNRYDRIIATNSCKHIQDIEKFFEFFIGKNFNIYLTSIQHNYELVIIDEKEVFILFFKPEKDVIGSTLYLPGRGIAERFIAIFDNRLRGPDSNIYPVHLEYMKEADIEAKLDKIRNIFSNSIAKNKCTNPEEDSENEP